MIEPCVVDPNHNSVHSQEEAQQHKEASGHHSLKHTTEHRVWIKGHDDHISFGNDHIPLNYLASRSRDFLLHRLVNTIPESCINFDTHYTTQILQTKCTSLTIFTLIIDTPWSWSSSSNNNTSSKNMICSRAFSFSRSIRSDVEDT